MITYDKKLFHSLVLFFFSAISMISASSINMTQVRFDKPVNLSGTPTDSANPDIAAIDDQVFVFWFDQVPGISDILLAHSTDRGVTFRTWNLTRDYQIQHSLFPRVAADGKNIYVGWGGQGRLDNRSTWAPFLSRSNDGGASFRAPFDISGRAAYGRVIMRIQDNILYATGAWYNPLLLDILFVKSSDLGETFSEPIRVSSNPREWQAQSSPELAVDRDHIYMVWTGWRPGLVFQETYFGRSIDAGKTFCKTINLSNITEERGISVGPQLAVGSKGYVYVAWNQGILQDVPFIQLMDVYFARSTDNGKTFGDRLNLSKSPEAFNGGAYMVAAGTNIYITWNARGHIFFSRSTDAGETFSEPRNISNNPFGAAGGQIAVIEKGRLLDDDIAEDVIYVVWQGGPGNRIYFTASVDGGATFSEPENISNTPNYSGGPRIAAVGRNVYVTWMGTVAGRFQAFFIRGELEINNRSLLFDPLIDFSR